MAQDGSRTYFNQFEASAGAPRRRHILLVHFFAATIHRLPFAMDTANIDGQAALTLSPSELLEHPDSALHSPTLSVHISPDDPILLQVSWLDSLVQALQPYSDLTHLTVSLPRITPSTEGPTFITLSSAADLWARLAEQGTQLQELRVVVSEPEPELYAAHKLIPPSLPPDLKELTFVVSAGGDEEEKSYHIHCPELLAAEAALSRGDLAALSSSGSYTSARKTVDDLTALVYEGIITPKRKPRPMPEYLTPEEMEDRLGPPGLARRAKRALLGFAGGFRAPGTERPGRTAKERAQLREVDWRGRPGWSKSALAERVVWRR